jgi:hypothetical protein
MENIICNMLKLSMTRLHASYVEFLSMAKVCTPDVGIIAWQDCIRHMVKLSDGTNESAYATY